MYHKLIRGAVSPGRKRLVGDYDDWNPDRRIEFTHLKAEQYRGPIVEGWPPEKPRYIVEKLFCLGKYRYKGWRSLAKKYSGRMTDRETLRTLHILCIQFHGMLYDTYIKYINDCLAWIFVKGYELESFARIFIIPIYFLFCAGT